MARSAWLTNAYTSSASGTNLDSSYLQHSDKEVVELLPQFAAKCHRTLVLLDPALFTQPLAILELFVAMAAHWDPQRIVVEPVEGCEDRPLPPASGDCVL